MQLPLSHKTSGLATEARPAPVMRPFRAPELLRATPYPKVDWDLAGPIDLEIGCGSGLHPIRYGQEHPDRRLIAIEHTAERFAKFQGRLKNHSDLTNVTAVHGNAISLVSEAVPLQRLDRVFILYPNPYPRPRHKNRRWALMPFMGRLVQSVRPGGTIHIATNFEWYAEEAASAMQDLWGLEVIALRSISAAVDSDFRPRTHFEKKYLAAGMTCYDLVCRVRESN